MLVQIIVEPMHVPNIMRSRPSNKNVILQIKGIIELDKTSSNLEEFIKNYTNSSEFILSANYYTLFCSRANKIRDIVLYRAIG